MKHTNGRTSCSLDMVNKRVVESGDDTVYDADMQGAAISLTMRARPTCRRGDARLCARADDVPCAPSSPRRAASFVAWAAERLGLCCKDGMSRQERQGYLLRLARLAMLLASVSSSSAEAYRAVIVVRHAEKASWTDADAPLALQGEDRALTLASLLRNAGVTHVFVSQKRRTQQTAQPLVEQRGLPPPTVLPAQETTALVNALRALPSDAVALVVGHSDTIPLILSGLGVRDRVVLRDDQYGRIFLVTADSRLVELAY